jgi:ankyrin repeat protein
MLLNAGAEVDSLDDDGQSPLDLALTHGAFRNERVLIVHGAKISAAARLTLMREAGDAKMVEALLKRGFRF